MAYITFQNKQGQIDQHEEVASFLASQEVIYENWDISKLPAALVEKYLLSDAEKEEILQVFAAEISNISARRGYKSQDVISLSENTPNLEVLLQNFKQEHHHTDDEVRFIVSGHGVFVIQGNDNEFFEVHLNPGDLISVPENTRHYFTLEDDRKVVAIRIFVTTEGWVPIYEKQEVKN
ncbi:cupin domain-containing protein [Bacillus sp. BRMEA1]|uniref:1,2-dihydroxy-3-keto-5-methylthiopentene dioxygenase n=1 Tax=Neobacillus endophyticus TaxID=2738405 RepID=UPI001566525C|nr:cupin domain-containing protein [Neobacillus endophyticus]NRD78671.1 cupin domain-containing protein [Neobacillus endophyticus]